MKPNQLAIIIAFYLSKYNKVGITSLGYKNDSEAFSHIAEILGVKKNYIKFRRDEFDPIHSWRKGWKRPMDKRIVRAVEVLQDLSEIDLREIVQKILSNKDFHKSDDILRINSLFEMEEETKDNNSNYILRGPTGKKAEEIFMEHHRQNSKPIGGELVDTRELGCGYDFKIINEETFYIEVKGSIDEDCGVVFTGKEWEIAQKYRERYIVVLVTNIRYKPIISFIKNPAEKINAKKYLVARIQVQWNVTENEIASVKRDIY